MVDNSVVNNTTNIIDVVSTNITDIVNNTTNIIDVVSTNMIDFDEISFDLGIIPNLFLILFFLIYKWNNF